MTEEEFKQQVETFFTVPVSELPFVACHLPEALKDCCNTGIGQMVRVIDGQVEFPRKGEGK